MNENQTRVWLLLAECMTIKLCMTRRIVWHFQSPHFIPFFCLNMQNAMWCHKFDLFFFSLLYDLLLPPPPFKLTRSHHDVHAEELRILRVSIFMRNLMKFISWWNLASFDAETEKNFIKFFCFWRIFRNVKLSVMLARATFSIMTSFSWHFIRMLFNVTRMRVVMIKINVQLDGGLQFTFAQLIIAGISHEKYILG